MKKISYKPLDSIWLKASVLGSFWASVEIILGSFLHNLNVPVSGTILSFISVYLMIAFLQIWKENGIIIRAGLVCALMKSISPSSIILGPMIGILTEAMLLEFFIWLLGKNLLGYIVGGSLAVLSALLHKLVSLLIMYGLDFIKILTSLYQFAVKQINLSSSDPVTLVIIITLIYILAGATAAIAGYVTGNKYLRKQITDDNQPDIQFQSDFQLFTGNSKQSYSVYNLLLNITAIIISLLLINLEINIVSVTFPLIYLGFCIYNYRTSLNRLKKISVWVQFALITLIAAFLWNGISEHDFLSVTGLIIGLKMIFRALIIIIGFATISVELKNPLIKSVLYKKGFANLYQSVNLVFSALPGIISNLPDSKMLIRKPGMFITQVFNRANRLLYQFEKTDQNRPDIIIVSGDKHSGKTTFVKNLVEKLTERGIKVSGFLSIGIHENGILSGFNIIELNSSGSTELCTIKKHDGWLNFGHFYFNPLGILRGNEILDIKNLALKDIVIIDEIGPVELNGNGWSSSIDSICEISSITQLWVVRESLVEKVIKRWNAGNVYIFNIEEDSLQDAENKIIKILKKTISK